MNAALKKISFSLGKFFGRKRNRRFIYLVALSLFALADFLFSGLVRRTFVFYSNIDGNPVVEDRMLRRSGGRSGDRETDIRRYMDEVLLGPVSPDSALLFPRETRLHAFMYRDAAVYADLSEVAALPSDGDVFRNLLTLNEGIRRNFSYVKDVKLFIGGNEVFFNEFHGIFGDPADNSKAAP
jgi:hypothetical protein